MLPTINVYDATFNSIAKIKTGVLKFENIDGLKVSEKFS